MSTYTDHLKYMSKQITKMREKKGLSKSRLASLSGIDRSFLVRVESGKQNVSVRHLLLLAKTLQVPIRYFFPFLMGVE